MKDFELRFVDAKEIRVEPAAEGKPERLTGYAAVFNSPSEDLGGFREIIQRGAFSETLAGSKDVRALVSHDPDKLLGRTANGTLRLSEDDHGLRFDVDMPDTSYARDTMALVKRKDIRGMSFGFRVPKGGDTWAKIEGNAVRTVKTAHIGEVSVAASPAYRDTELSVRVDPACAKRAVEVLDDRKEFCAREKALRTILLVDE